METSSKPSLTLEEKFVKLMEDQLALDPNNRKEILRELICILSFHQVQCNVKLFDTKLATKAGALGAVCSALAAQGIMEPIPQ